MDDGWTMEGERSADMGQRRAGGGDWGRLEAVGGDWRRLEAIGGVSPPSRQTRERLTTCGGWLCLSDPGGWGRSGYQRLRMTTNVYQWRPTSTNGDQRLPMTTNVYQWRPMPLARSLACLLGGTHTPAGLYPTRPRLQTLEVPGQRPPATSSINQLLEQYAGRSRIQGPHQVRPVSRRQKRRSPEFCDGIPTHSILALPPIPGTFSSAALGRRGISPCLSTSRRTSLGTTSTSR